MLGLRSHRSRSLPLLTTVLLLATASVLAAGPRPSARVEKKLLRKLDRCLTEKAFVLGTDFDDWRQRLDVENDALARSDSDSDWVRALNRALRSFEVSHLMVETPRATAARKTGREVGAGFKALPVADERIVTFVLPDSPATAIDLRRGDRIRAVDDAPVGEAQDEEHFSAAGRLHGQLGETRKIVWQRGEVRLEEEIGYAEFRSGIAMTLDWRDGDVAWLRLSSFRPEVYDPKAVADAMRRVRDRGASGMVLDLRSNGGGRLRHVLHFASMFLPHGTVVARKFDRFSTGLPSGPADVLPNDVGEAIALPNDVGDLLYDGPLVILTDGTNGSGGDLFPGFMQKAGRATIVGGRTAGALLGGTWCDLGKGYRLLYPLVEIVLTDGSRIEGVGVTPDIELSIDDTIDDEAIASVALETVRAPAQSGP